MAQEREHTDESMAHRVVPCAETAEMDENRETLTDKPLESPAETAVPVNDDGKPKMKIVSGTEMDAVAIKLLEAQESWPSVVAELETVCIQSEDDQSTLLHTLAGESSTQGLTAHLLEAGVPPNIENEGGYTALHVAAIKGNLADCKLLCEYGADISAGASTCQSAVDAAVKYGHHDLMLWLLHHNNYRPQWSNELFAGLCEKSPSVAVAYLDLFAVDLAWGAPETDELPKRLRLSPGSFYGTKASVYYFDLAAIYGPPSLSVAATALALVTKTPVACDALACKVMRYMIKAKWLAFGRAMFKQEVLLYSMLLAAFSVSVICEQLSLWNGFHTPRQLVIGIGRIVAAVCSCVLLVHVERRELRVEGPAYFSSFWNLLALGTYVGIILIVAYQASGARSELLQVATGVLNISLWVNAFQYLQMAQSVAVLITMMSQMVNDVVKFIVLYSMFLFGFSGGFYVLLLGNPGYETFVDALITVLLMLFGQINYDPFHAVSGLTGIVSNLLLLAYLVSVVIVLLNLLIAMMSTSYSRVWEEAEGQVLLCYAQAIVRMEKSITKADRVRQFETLKTDAQERRDKLPRRRWEVVETLIRERTFMLNHLQVVYWRSNDVLSDPASYSLAKCMVATLEYFATSVLLNVYYLGYESARRRDGSTSPLVMNAVTSFSTLEDGERWEVVRKKPSADLQADLSTRVDNLTALVEQQTALIKGLHDSIQAIAAQRGAPNAPETPPVALQGL